MCAMFPPSVLRVFVPCRAVQGTFGLKTLFIRSTVTRVLEPNLAKGEMHAGVKCVMPVPLSPVYLTRRGGVKHVRGGRVLSQSSVPSACLYSAYHVEGERVISSALHVLFVLVPSKVVQSSRDRYIFSADLICPQIMMYLSRGRRAHGGVANNIAARLLPYRAFPSYVLQLKGEERSTSPALHGCTPLCGAGHAEGTRVICQPPLFNGL